jgi:hypothetical protein
MISLIIGSTTDPWFTYMWTRSIYLDQEGILKEKNMFTVQGIYYFMKVIPGDEGYSRSVSVDEGYFQKRVMCTKFESVSDCCLMPIEQFFSYIMVRTS